jgi:hypothetical protein
MYKFFILLNVTMAIVNVVNGLILESSECMLVAILNLACAYILDATTQVKK